MIELKYKDINNHNFVQGLRTLVNTPFHLKMSYQIGRIQDKIMTESKVAQAEWQRLVTSKVEWVGEGENKTPKDLEAFKKLEQEFLDLSFKIDKWKKIHVQDIHVAKLKPLEMLALEPILEGLETLEDGGENGEEKSV